MTGCSECTSEEPHEPEECPAAEWFSSGPTGGACEYAYLRTPEGSALAGRPDAGSVRYYEDLINAVDMMHSIGECPL